MPPEYGVHERKEYSVLSMKKLYSEYFLGLEYSSMCSKRQKLKAS